MAKFILSAFSDEYSSDFDRQIEGLKENGITHMEIRGVNGKNILDLSDSELDTVKEKLTLEGITVSSIGSPLGKIQITDPFEPHLDKTRRAIEIAKKLGTRNIRMFSFYISDGDLDGHRSEVMRRLSAMADEADKAGVYLCHENEKGIYGANADRCLDIQEEFAGRIKCVFDPGNFIQEKVETFPYAFELLKDKIYYMHIKDAVEDGTIVASGYGIARIKDIIDSLRSREQTYYLTVEPHLRVFAGLEKLETGEHPKVGSAYSSSEEAFGAAVTALKEIVFEK